MWRFIRVVMRMCHQGWVCRGGEHGRRRNGVAAEVDQRETLPHGAGSVLHGHRSKPTQARGTQLRLLAAGEGGETVHILLKNKKKTPILQGNLASLARRADLVATTLNTIPGFSCNTVQGAMYAFPQLHLPRKAVEAALNVGQFPDVFYAFQLLEATGECLLFNIEKRFSYPISILSTYNV